MSWTIQIPNDGIVRATPLFQLQAELFGELTGQTVMAVTGGGGEPFRRMGRLVSVTLRLSASSAFWQLRVKMQNDRWDTVRVNRDFPNDPLILLHGAHDIDFDRLALPPVAANYAAVWRAVSRYCVEAAGKDAVLIDTIETAIAVRKA